MTCVLVCFLWTEKQCSGIDRLIWLIPPGHNSLMREIRAGTQTETVRESGWGVATYLLSGSAGFPVQLRPTCLGVVLPTSVIKITSDMITG